MEISHFIHRCIEVEKSVASLYRTFTELFPEEKDFWQDLLNDEEEHTSFLKGSVNMGLTDELKNSALHPSIDFIETTLRHTERIRNQIHRNPLSLEDALNVALMIEKNMVETFANDLVARLLSYDDSSLLENILMGERLHIDKIREKMVKKGYTRLS